MIENVTEKPFYMCEMISLYSELESACNQEVSSCQKNTHETLRYLSTMHDRKIELMRTHAQELKAKQFWGIFSTATQYVVSIGSIVSGTALFPVSPISSVLVISGGVLGLSNRIIADSGGWRFLASHFTPSLEKQLLLAGRIDTCFVCASAGISLVSAVGAYQTGAFALLSAAGIDQVSDKTIRIIQLSGGAIQTIGQIGETRANKCSLDIKAALKIHNTETELIHDQIDTTNEELTKTISLLKEIRDRLNQAIADSKV